MEVNLIVANGKLMGKKIPVASSKFLIGRGEECNLRPQSSMVSRKHCVILVERDSAAIEDLGSTNGTFVNDERLAERRQLNNGDRIKVGMLELEVQLAVAERRRPTCTPFSRRRRDGRHGGDERRRLRREPLAGRRRGGDGSPRPQGAVGGRRHDGGEEPGRYDGHSRSSAAPTTAEERGREAEEVAAAAGDEVGRQAASPARQSRQPKAAARRPTTRCGVISCTRKTRRLRE